MRKLFALLLILCLVPFAAMAQTMDYDFGDFTMTIPADIMGQINEKVNAQPYFILYPDYVQTDSLHQNLNCVWTAGYEDVASMDGNALGKQVINNMSNELKAQGLVITNGKVETAQLRSINGVNALLVAYTYDCDFSGLNVDIQCPVNLVQCMFSFPDKGSYVFSYTFYNSNSTDTTLAMLNSIKWN